MSGPELLHRVREAARTKVEPTRATPSPQAVWAVRSGQGSLSGPPRGFPEGRYRFAADRILNGEFQVFGMGDTRLAFPPQWNRDPKTGTEAPITFGKALNYRDERIVGDIKYLWEPNRHLELVTLAQAWHLTAEPKYLHGCRTLLDSWFDQCPYPLGLNWTSSLELGIRLTNWAIAWQLLGSDTSNLFEGPDGAAFRRRWLDSVYLHYHFIAGNLSRYSSANNHLLGELMGLLIASLTWPMWPESSRWRDNAVREFEAEALKQNAPDGVNREQAFWYHHEVADMMLLCGLAARANGIEFTPAYWERLESMMEFMAAVMDCDGNTPMVGDSDDGVMVRFVPGPFNVYRSLLATGAILFKRQDFKAKAGPRDDKTRWLLGEHADLQYDALDAPVATSDPRREFPDGGYWILGDKFDTPEEVRIVADAGPLGYLSIAAHGHADALAFTLSIGGESILIDPGTYAYHTQSEWRDYFRGTAAHNTVRIDGQDQSLNAGNFLWLKHARARCLGFSSLPDEDRWMGEHDGYRRLRDPVSHRRQLVLSKPACTLTVTDHLEARKNHRAEWHWHCGEHCSVELTSDGAIIQGRRARVHVAISGAPVTPRIAMGEIDPPLGWISRRYDLKVPAPCLTWALAFRDSAELVTRFTIEELG